MQARPDSAGVQNDAMERFGAAMEYGARGVQVFFCISGFILGLPFARYYLSMGNRVSLRSYYLRRLTRLEPPLLINLLLLFAVYLIVQRPSLAEGLPHLLATMFYIHNPIYGTVSPINTVTWSLEVEAQFYLCAPWLCLIFAIRQIHIRRSLMLVLIFISGLSIGVLPRYTLVPQLPFFFAGFLLADVYLTDWNAAPKSVWWGDWLGLISVVLFVVTICFRKSIWLPMAWQSLFIASFFAAVFRSVWLRKFFRLRALVTLGGMCYTFYLYHLAIISAGARGLEKVVSGAGYFTTYLIYVLATGATCVVLCSVLFALFERPFMKWRPVSGNLGNGLWRRTSVSQKDAGSPEGA